MIVALSGCGGKGSDNDTNNTPMAIAQTIVLQEDISVDIELMANEGSNDELTYIIVSQPGRGVLSAVNSNQVTYTPAVDFAGEDSFTFKVNDGVVDSNVVTVTLDVEDVPDPTGKLNDSGITVCGNATDNRLDCPQTDFPNQDAQTGRDFDNNDDSDGHAGFSFTKVDVEGNALLANATIWSCVKDSVTGLTWEVKAPRGSGGLHDADNYYSWYDTNMANNAGYAGKQNGGTCQGSGCDTLAYAQAMNSVSYCGYNNWRLPTVEELSSIVDYGRYNPAIDTDYFPSLDPRYWEAFWSSSSASYHSSYEDFGLGAAVLINFFIGTPVAIGKEFVGRTRLVRSEQ